MQFQIVLEVDPYVIKIVAGERGNYVCRKLFGIDVATVQNKALYLKSNLISDQFTLLGTLLQKWLIVFDFPERLACAGLELNSSSSFLQGKI